MQLRRVDSQYVKLSEGAVERFHEQFNTENYQMMYDQTAESLRQIVSAEIFSQSMSEDRKKFGQVKSTKLSDWDVRDTMSGPLVHLTYDTEFTNGDAVELFSFVIKDGKAWLGAYMVKPR